MVYKYISIQEDPLQFLIFLWMKYMSIQEDPLQFLQGLIRAYLIHLTD